MAEGSFEIHLPQFEGPFDLLLFFIERDELDIQAISLAKITNDFLEYIYHLSSLNVEVASDFILVAASLMRIKARTLLPVKQQDENEEGKDNEQELINRLIAYKYFKEQSALLKLKEEQQFLRYKRGNISVEIASLMGSEEFGEELENLTLFRLIKIYEQLKNKLNKQLAKPHHIVVQNPFTIIKQKETILELLKLNQLLSYDLLKTKTQSKIEMVYNFLAILEMVQENLVSIEIGIGFNNFFVQRPSA